MSGSTSDASLIVPDFTISLSGSSCNYLFSFSIYSLPSHSVIQRNCKIREFNSHLTEASLKVPDFTISKCKAVHAILSFLVSLFCLLFHIYSSTSALGVQHNKY